MVNEFQKVFLEDLFEVPFERQIDFRIEFLLDTPPISIPPYRIAWTELKKMEKQLKDHLYNGFIMSKFSP